MTPTTLTFALNPSLESVQAEIALLQAKLNKASQPFRAPPPVPSTCCGRGCNGCVWESYYAAAAWWVEEATNLPAIQFS